MLLRGALQISLLFHKYKQLAGHLNTTAIAVKVGWEHRCFVPLVSQAMAGAKMSDFMGGGPPGTEKSSIYVADSMCLSYTKWANNHSINI